jgi:hypothetical protein
MPANDDGLEDDEEDIEREEENEESEDDDNMGLVATCIIEDDEVEMDIGSKPSDGRFVQGYGASTVCN